MPLVPVPCGKFDESFTLEALVRLFQPVDGKAAGGESPARTDEAEGAQEAHRESR